MSTINQLLFECKKTSEGLPNPHCIFHFEPVHSFVQDD